MIEYRRFNKVTTIVPKEIYEFSQNLLGILCDLDKRPAILIQFPGGYEIQIGAICSIEEASISGKEGV